MNYSTFLIKKRGKEVDFVYGTYEEARQLIRARIRRSVKLGRSKKLGMWDEVSRNPTGFQQYGYRIVRA